MTLVPVNSTRIAPASLLHIDRFGDTVRVQMKQYTNHELRVVILALWWSLDPDDRADHLKEMEHYLAFEPGTYLPPMALDIASALMKARHA